MSIPLCRVARTSPTTRKFRGSRAFTVICAVLLLLAGAASANRAAVAAGDITDLGQLTNTVSTNSYFPLSGFHRIRANLRHGKQIELLFIGTQFDPMSNAERWPVVKALKQFGTFRTMAVVPRTCSPGPANSTICSVPTFDWSHAGYTSNYVYFLHRDIADQNSRLYQTLSGTASKLYDQYARGYGKTPLDQIRNSTSIPATSTRRLPLVAIGNYLQTISEGLQPADFQEIITLPQQPGMSFQGGVGSGLPFDTVQQALLSGQDPKETKLNEDVNGETNVIIALICHADKLQPARVCGRSVIKRILRHVK